LKRRGNIKSLNPLSISSVRHTWNTRLQYFYQSFLKNFPDKIPDEQQFRYPGRLPFSKETAVLMMADSVEASSRRLQHPDEKSITDSLRKSSAGKSISSSL
jgi:membrane-associated HD superfamily phosphohydrolase